MVRWCNIVFKIGEAGIDINEYSSIFLHQIENLYEELISDLDAIHHKTLDKIASLLEKLQVLCKDLHVPIPTFNHGDEVPLCDIYQLVRQKVEEYEALVQIRRRELLELQQKQTHLCKNLGREPKLIKESPLPLPKEIEDLKTYIEELENEALEREELYFQRKGEIAEIIGELGVEPNLNFIQDILDLTNSQVKITDTDMEQLQTYHSQLIKKSQSVKEEIDDLRGKIDDLWKKLEIDIGERDAFREKYTGNSLKILGALKAEVNRLEEMKKANIKKFINKQREELQTLWEKCHCTQKEKDEFTFYYSECYNEDLFELHEREIDKWKFYFEQNKDILLLLNEHAKLWNDHLQLELNAGGANRYKNRGGQLLQEEKKRNKFKKRIPQIEEMLQQLSDAYLIRNGTDFLTHGLTIKEHIEKLHQDADKQFKLKLSAKKQQRDQMHQASMNPTLTPSYCSKRKFTGTPMSVPVKKAKVSTRKKATTGLPKLNVSVNRRRSARREKLRQRLSFKKDSDKENHNDVASTSYHKFEVSLLI